jgi:hypothetical protein
MNPEGLAIISSFVKLHLDGVTCGEQVTALIPDESLRYPD